MTEKKAARRRRGRVEIELHVEYVPDRERMLRGLLVALGWSSTDIERVISEMKKGGWPSQDEEGQREESGGGKQGNELY